MADSLLGVLVAGIVESGASAPGSARKRGVRKEGTTPAQTAAYAERTRKARDMAIKKLRPQIEMLRAKFALDDSSPSGLVWISGQARQGRPVFGKPAGTRVKDSATYLIETGGRSIRADAVVELLKELETV